MTSLGQQYLGHPLELLSQLLLSLPGLFPSGESKRVALAQLCQGSLDLADEK